ncbi:DUF2155 domain-containing protein [Jannaschia sp. KMU-145]|uniref:DUF2155 domain-containing protein n=1 Tax=Jannaschia halovivens TaxID=3388667 RepID=UPI00396AF041
MIRAAGAFLALSLALAGMAEAQAVRTSTGMGAVLRTLDKVSGEVIDVEMASGQTMAYGPLQVTLHECRFPSGNLSGDAFGLIQVVDARAVEELFAGWMVASSPGLNALEHRRYDVWLLRCITAED